MKINAISIVPQHVGCNGKCKYCVAHLTNCIRKQLKTPGINIPKLDKCIRYAKDYGASTAIITSSGETLLGSWTNIENILWICKKYFGQIDLHTNGLEITRPPEFGKDFSQMLAPYLTNITITVPHYKKEICQEHGLDTNYEQLFKKLVDLGIVIRLSCVVAESGIASKEDFEKYILYYKDLGVSQIVFREIWQPNATEIGDDDKVKNWCEENYISQRDIDMILRCLSVDKELNLWGNGQPYEVDGVAVSSSTCTQNVKKEVTKSVVYRPNNKLYSDWDTKCPIM